MADFSLGSSGTGRLETWENWNASTQTSFHYKLQAEIRNGAYNAVGDASWNGTLAGGHVGSGNWTYTSNGWRTLREFDVTINKDANGNLTINTYGYINGANGGTVGAGSTNWNISPARIGVAPTITGISADTIKQTSARLGTEISSFGLGTIAATRIYYRIQGSGSVWSQTADANDTAGYNYFTVTSLKPNKTYEYFARWWNNNNDTADSGALTFKTKSIAGAAAVMMKLVAVQ